MDYVMKLDKKELGLVVAILIGFDVIAPLISLTGSLSPKFTNPREGHLTSDLFPNASFNVTLVFTSHGVLSAMDTTDVQVQLQPSKGFVNPHGNTLTLDFEGSRQTPLSPSDFYIGQITLTKNSTGDYNGGGTIIYVDSGCWHVGFATTNGIATSSNFSGECIVNVEPSAVTQEKQTANFTLALTFVAIGLTLIQTYLAISQRNKKP